MPTRSTRCSCMLHALRAHAPCSRRMARLQLGRTSMLPIFLLAVAIASTFAGAANSCATDFDCTLSGACIDGACKCDKPCAHCLVPMHRLARRANSIITSKLQWRAALSALC